MNKENASKLWKIIQEAGDYFPPSFTTNHCLISNISSRISSI